MYLIDWNHDTQRIEASLGGHITLTEAKVFTDDLIERLKPLVDEDFSFQLDYSKASRLDPGVSDVLQRAQSYCQLHGARKITFIAKDDYEAELLIGQRLQQVLEGVEEYVVFRSAA